MNENTFIDSFFFHFNLFCLIVFLFCLHFCLLSQFKNDALWNHWLLFKHIFCWNTTQKRKHEKSFLGACLVAQTGILISQKTWICPWIRNTIKSFIKTWYKINWFVSFGVIASLSFLCKMVQIFQFFLQLL